MEVSVLIIVKNENAIRRTLDALSKQIQTDEQECLVIDASNPPLSSLEQDYPWITLHKFPLVEGRTITIPHQRNFAVKKASGRCILFCDAGGIPCEDWIIELSTPLLTGQFDLVGGPIESINKWAPYKIQNLQKWGDRLKISSSANLGFTSAVYKMLEGFEEGLDYGSDAEFIWRASKIGIKHSAVPSALMQLDGGSLTRELKRSWLYGKAIVDLLRLHSNQIRPKMIESPEMFIYPILIVVWLFLIPISCYLNFQLILLNFFVALHFIIILKNFKSKRPLFSLLLNYLHGLGSLYRLFMIITPRSGDNEH